MPSVSAFVLVALLWGATNPWLKRASERHGKLSMWQLLLKLDYLIPLVLNLLGSVAFYWFLGDAEVSVAVPVTNALTLAVTAVMGAMLGEQFGSIFRLVVGVGLVLTGVYIISSS